MFGRILTVWASVHKPLVQLLIDSSCIDCLSFSHLVPILGNHFFFCSPTSTNRSALDWFNISSGTVSGQSHGNPGPLITSITLCCFFDFVLLSYKDSQQEMPFASCLPSPNVPEYKESKEWENCFSRTFYQRRVILSPILSTLRKRVDIKV